MFKKIYLSWMVICISAFYTLVTNAQTCNLVPTCAELGFTQTTTECEGRETLFCPLNKTAVFCGEDNTCIPKDCTGYTLASCPSGATCSICTIGCGDELIRYQKNITLLINASPNQKLAFSASGTDLMVDWGDGAIDSNQTHTYTTGGEYTVAICGTITEFSMQSSTVNKIQILSLAPSIKTLQFQKACNKIIGSIPELPNSLTNGESMFQGCSNLTGSIPTLPDSLSNGKFMFSGCSNLTGPIIKLPRNLTDGTYMFYNNTGITGTIPKLPNNLIYGNSMFANCSGLRGSVPELPSTLIDGYTMFYYCYGLTGMAPSKPSGLTSYTNMFRMTRVTNDGSWPSSAW